MPLAPQDYPQRRVCNEISKISDRATHSTQAGTHGAYRSGTAERRQEAPRDGKGYQDLIRVSEGLDLVLCNRVRSRDEVVNFIGEGVLKLHFRLSGHSRVDLEGETPFELNGAGCGLMLHPIGMNKIETARAGVAEQWAVIHCHSSFLNDALGAERDELPSSLGHFLRNESYVGYQRSLPFTPRMSQGLRELLGSTMTSALRNIEVEGRCLDLISHALDLLMKSDSHRSAQLSRRDSQSIQHACAILQRDFRDPPTLRELARSVGINRNKLNHGFRSMFGLTVGDFVTECRMRSAHDLLQLGEHSVSRVAHLVGYDFPGNFTTAFKRYYGILPRALKAPLDDTH